MFVYVLILSNLFNKYAELFLLDCPVNKLVVSIFVLSLVFLPKSITSPDEGANSNCVFLPENCKIEKYELMIKHNRFYFMCTCNRPTNSPYGPSNASGGQEVGVVKIRCGQ